MQRPWITQIVRHAGIRLAIHYDLHALFDILDPPRSPPQTKVLTEQAVE
jgi:hypothetical protein